MLNTATRRTNDVKHIRVMGTGECYSLLTGESYATVNELIDHYMGNRGLVCYPADERSTHLSARLSGHIGWTAPLSGNMHTYLMPCATFVIRGVTTYP